jgi:type VI protein secretion system component Hcp
MEALLRANRASIRWIARIGLRHTRSKAIWGSFQRGKLNFAQFASPNASTVARPLLPPRCVLDQRKTVNGVLRFYGPDTEGGPETNYFRIEFDNGRVVVQDLMSLKWLQNDTTISPQSPQLEHVSLKYAKIRWIHSTTGNEHEASTPKGTIKNR